MNRSVHGLRLITLAAWVAARLASAQAPGPSLAAGGAETNATAVTNLAPTAAVPALETSQTNNASATNAPAETATASRSDRDNGPRSRRSDRRRDRTDGSVGGGGAGSGSSTNLPIHGTDFGAFQLIPDRNIFNVNRAGRASRTPREAPPKATQVDTFALVGAMSYAKGDFAFFDGSSSDFRKVLKPGETIAGFQIKTIGRGSVQLDAAGKALELAIGSHFRREDQGEWRLVAETAPASSSSSGRSERSESESSAGASGDGESKPASADAGGDANDILQRLMKKREQELVK